ncbi:hypothetical protein LWI29_014837 [Acer saccharum]|uniref:Uncharacterized protein n=1 Tax=Acer saccharum TaxID=4024 RepID=A0AA39T332_ACESA|nr:hypothetical protein LWI29_014837 [Acer saccharum]
MDKVLEVGKESGQNFYKDKWDSMKSTEQRSINRGSLGKAVAKLSKTKKENFEAVGDVEEELRNVSKGLNKSKRSRSNFQFLKGDFGTQKGDEDLISIPVEWEGKEEAIKNFKLRKDTDFLFKVKGHSMKASSSKFKLSGVIEDEIIKVIDMGIAMGFDFNGEKVRMADVFSKALSKLKGRRQNMAYDRTIGDVFPVGGGFCGLL